MPFLTNMLATIVLLLGISQASPTYGHDEQKPQHEYHRHGTPGCGKYHGKGDELKVMSIPTHDGQREFSIYIPASYDKHKATPVIMSFHGRDMNSGEHALQTHFNDSRVNHDMIAVFPQAVDCVWQFPLSPSGPVPDLQFARHLISYMRENYCIDDDRLYASGFDIGGGFINNLACSWKHDDPFAAYAMVSPTLYYDPTGPEGKQPLCNQLQSRPILQIFNSDREVDCCEAEETEHEAGMRPHSSFPHLLTKWAMRDGCNKTPDTCTKYGGLVKTISYICQGIEGFVQGIKVDGQKYGWPSTEASKGGKAAPVDASKKIIDFFKGHCKTPA